MKKIVLFVGALLMASLSSFVFAEMKISVVDLNKVFTDIQQVKDMQAMLKDKFDPRGKELVSMQDALRVDLDKYKQNNGKLKGGALKKEQQKIMDGNKKLQDARVSLQQDLAAAQNVAIAPILKKVEEVVGKIAQVQKIDLVITKTNVAYVNPGSQADITDQVIAEMKNVGPITASTSVAKPEATATAPAMVKKPESPKEVINAGQAQVDVNAVAVKPEAPKTVVSNKVEI